jgi:hypothetical protein
MNNRTTEYTTEYKHDPREEWIEGDTFYDLESALLWCSGDTEFDEDGPSYFDAQDYREKEKGAVLILHGTYAGEEPIAYRITRTN